MGRQKMETAWWCTLPVAVFEQRQVRSIPLPCDGVEQTDIVEKDIWLW